MNTHQKTSSSHIGSITSYTPPRLHEGKDWYIDFYAFDPAKNKTRRKKIKLNFITKISDRRKYADGLTRETHENNVYLKRLHPIIHLIFMELYLYRS